MLCFLFYKGFLVWFSFLVLQYNLENVWFIKIYHHHGDMMNDLKEAKKMSLLMVARSNVCWNSKEMIKSEYFEDNCERFG